MTKEELLELIKKGEATLLDSEGNDVTKHLENPEQSVESLTKKISHSQLEKLLKKNDLEHGTSKE